MKKFFLTWLVNSAALIVAANIYSGIRAESWQILIVAALVLGLLNAFFKPGIMLATLPLNIMSLGIFTLFINGAMFYALSRLVNGFYVNGFWGAFWGALLFSVINTVFSGMAKVSVHSSRVAPEPRPVHTGKVIDTEIVDTPGEDRRILEKK